MHSSVDDCGCRARMMVGQRRGRRLPARWSGHAPAAGLSLAAGLGLLVWLLAWAISSAAPRWVVMWSLAATMLLAAKGLTWLRSCPRRAASWLQVGYCLAWPGMDAESFFAELPSEKPRWHEWTFAACKLVLGVVVVFALTRLVPADRPYLVGWTGMVGIVMILHFGALHLISCAWRNAGFTARPLMHWPLLTTSVGDFWGRRWNTAFRDLTYTFLFRPLTHRIGPRGAIIVGFAVSGLIHEVVISLPAGSGYGGPTTFFVLQGLATLMERSRFGRRLGLRRQIVGRLFAAMVLLLPVCMLFHSPFVLGVVLPFLEFLGAI